MSSTRRTLAAALYFVLAACGGTDATGQSDAGTSDYSLTFAGNPNLVLHPGEKRTLEVLLSQDQIGPVVNGAVHFEFQDGDPAGATLEAANVNTDQNGIATVHYTAGSTSNGRPTYKVVASAPSYDAQPVAFSFNIIAVRRLLQIVGTPAVHVSTDGQSATAAIGISTSTALKVRELDQDTGNPIAGDTIRFTLPSATLLKWSGAGGATSTAQTGAGGEAQVFLLSTQSPEGPVLVSALSSKGALAVSFSVTVQAAGSSSCTSSQQCNPGQTCVGGHCQDGGGTGCDNGSDNPCPFGYLCFSGVCQPPSGGTCDPNAPTCANGQCCDPSSLACKNVCPSACGPGTHCQPGDSCGIGSCVSDGPGTPDVTGVWLTKHTYSIREALPQTVQDIFKAIRLLDQALLGKLTIPGIPGWLQDLINKFVSNLLKQYLPDWLQSVIHISDGIVTILSDLRSEGSMRLTKGVDIAHVKGNEVWTSLVFYWLPLCNGQIGGDPDVPPDCARIDLATTDADVPGEVGQCKGQSLPSITVQAKPFSATVAPLSSGSTTFALTVDRRQVSIKMGKVVLVLVDLIISYLTPYHCIEEATDCAHDNTCMVDCAGLGRDIENLTGGWVPAGTVEQLCEGVVTAAGQAVTLALANAWPVNADLLDFDGKAVISHVPVDAGLCDAGSTGSCAGQLGQDTFDKDLHSSNATTRANREGAWSGDFFFKLLHKLPGAWEAKRPQ